MRYPNLKHYGTISREKWPDYVYENSAILRICRHDTLPMSSCEFLMAGRDVITNIPMEYANIIDTSGTDEVSRWDKFGEGLNVYHWPETKKKIIQSIRLSRKFSEFSDDIVYKEERSDYYKKLLDREAYLKKIKEFCGV